jgi:hypothetical protein
MHAHAKCQISRSKILTRTKRNEGGNELFILAVENGDC